MEKKDLDWSSLGFGYRQTEKRYVTNYKNGAWDDVIRPPPPWCTFRGCHNRAQ